MTKFHESTDFMSIYIVSQNYIFKDCVNSLITMQQGTGSRYIYICFSLKLKPALTPTGVNRTHEKFRTATHARSKN
jgi:hypothetical protein